MSTPVIRLRPCLDSDREFLFTVYASTRAEELAVVPWSDRQRQKFLRAQFDAQDSYFHAHFPRCDFYVVAVDGEDAGRLYVDRCGVETRIVDIALLPGFRRRGVGSTLLRSIQAEAAESEVPVRIHVEIGNPARGLYARMGFRGAGESGVYELMEWRSSAK